MQEPLKDRNHPAGQAQRHPSREAAPQSLTPAPSPTLIQRLRDLPESLRVAEIQALQRSAGNHAVQRLLSSAPTEQDADPGMRAHNDHTPIAIHKLNQATQAGATVQRIGTGELQGRGIAMGRLAEDAPETGVNLWVATNPRIPATIYLLGTAHGLKLSEMGADAAAREYLINFLRTEAFTHVFTEMAAKLPGATHVPNLAKLLEEKRKAVQTLSGFPAGGPPASERKNYIAYRKAIDAVSVVDSHLAGNDLPLDDAYLSLAHRPRAGMKAGPKVGALEDDPRRLLAHETNIRDMGLLPHDPGHKLRRAPGEVVSGSEDVVRGNQKALFTEAALEAKGGRDVANGEQRNKQWMKRVSPDNVKPNDKQLWIIGAAHLAGLVLRFQDIHWTVTHQAPPPSKKEED